MKVHMTTLQAVKTFLNNRIHFISMFMLKTDQKLIVVEDKLTSFKALITLLSVNCGSIT